MRVIVCGGRDYEPIQSVWPVLDAISDVREISCIVHGDCKHGVDPRAGDWARLARIACEPHPADWTKYGKAAGMIRNKCMAERGADLCIAFPGGTGTADMVKQARKAGIQVLDLRTPKQGRLI